VIELNLEIILLVIGVKIPPLIAHAFIGKKLLDTWKRAEKHAHGKQNG